MTTGLLPTTRPPEAHPGVNGGRAWRTKRRRRRRLLTTGVLTAGLTVTLAAVALAPRTGLTLRQWRLLAHSGAGILVLHALAGGVDGLLLSHGSSRAREWLRRLRAVSLAVGAWAAVLLGTWGTYPAYHAAPPADAGDLTGYPQAWLLDHPDLAWWHSVGMQWKAWVGWLAPPLLTAAAVIALTRGRHLVAADAQLRRLLMMLLAVGGGVVVVAASIGVALNLIHPNDYLR